MQTINLENICVGGCEGDKTKCFNSQLPKVKTPNWQKTATNRRFF